MEFKHLLAKSSNDPDNPRHEETLVGHTEAVVRSAKAILKFLQGANIPDEITKNWERFERIVLTGAVFHDLGKATNVFQGMLIKHPDFFRRNHPVRHEILSALLLTKINSPLRIFADAVLLNQDVWLLSWIIGGHHLKLFKSNPYSTSETDNIVRVTNIPRDFIFLGSHPDLKKLFSMLSSLNQEEYVVPSLNEIDIPVEEPDDLDSEYLEIIVDEYLEESENRAVSLQQEEKMLIAFAKAILISADVAGSALTKEKQAPSAWIEKHLKVVLSDFALQKIVEDRLKGNFLRPFQNKVASSKKTVTVTIAGCGTGKTIAAYEWAKKHAKGKKLYFCYPTTGTASSGFEDYLLAQTDMERTLIHSRSQVDLERMLCADYEGLLEENQRLSSLQTWSQQVVACTADTVLGLIQNHRRALFSFPALLKTAFVFDEIHSYDEKLFGALLIFLRTFTNISVLLMSATIPDNRLQALREILGDRMGKPIGGEAQLEELERYLLIWMEDKNDCWNEVEDALRNNKKVLWVCNTVNNAIQLYEDSLSSNLNIRPVLYHSRFRYKDRVCKQSDVISSFNEANGPAFVIATQVCEMSLDISADLMISALSPFASLIQRLGRLNRRAKVEIGRKRPAPCRSLIYNFVCDNGKPYRKKELEESKKALEKLLDKPCSQKVLAEALSQIQKQEDIAKYSAWLDGVWESDQRPLRSGNSAFTVLLQQDLKEIKKKLACNKQKPNYQTLAPWSIPILYRPEISTAEKFGGLPVIDDMYIEYDEERGARWRKKGWLMY